MEREIANYTLSSHPRVWIDGCTDPKRRLFDRLRIVQEDGGRIAKFSSYGLEESEYQKGVIRFKARVVLTEDILQP